MGKKNRLIFIIVIALLIAFISGLHYLTSFQEFRLHELYRRLYYIPIIITAFNFRIKGGVVLPVIISALYLPYIIFYSEHSNIALITNLFEIVMFFTVGSITGLLVEKLHFNMEEINNLHEQIRRADKFSAVGQLASGVAHEIRNPLAIIKTISQNLLYDAEEVDDDNKQGLVIIQEEVNRANRVIKELLDFAKYNKIQKSKTNINEILYNVRLLTSKYAQRKGVMIEYEEASGECEVYGDSEKLKQAFVNVILNAIEAIEVTGKVVIEVLQKKDVIEISFIDTGVGISDQIKENIFNPFYTTKDNGVGLGLAITYRIIDEHDGKIDIQSIKGKGTKVNISLPMFKGV